MDSVPRVPFDLTLQFNELIKLVINEDGENNPKNRPNKHQHGNNCHEHGDNCSAKNLGKWRDNIVPVDDEQRNNTHEHGDADGDESDLKFVDLHQLKITRRLAGSTSWDVKLCLDTARGADNDTPRIYRLKFEMGGAVVTIAFDEHICHFPLKIKDGVKQQWLPAASWKGDKS